MIGRIEIAGRMGERAEGRGLSAGDNGDNFQAVALGQRARVKFRGRHRLAVMLDDDTAWKEFLRQEETLDGAGELGGDFPAVGDDKRVAMQTIGAGLSRNNAVKTQEFDRMNRIYRIENGFAE